MGAKACWPSERTAAADIVVSAAVGVVGLEATYEAVKLGKSVALSNKEVLVAAGELVMAAANKAGRELLPVDSEHNAVHQCLRGGERGEVRRLVLTASGGPFRKSPLAGLKDVTPEQALAHPNWRMGNRITIDSATMMNKGFEVIEARWLFGMRPGSDRCGDSSAVHDSLDGGICGWFSSGTTRPNRHAHAHPICVNLSRAGGIQASSSRLVQAAPPRFCERFDAGGSRACGWQEKR